MNPEDWIGIAGLLLAAVGALATAFFASRKPAEETYPEAAPRARFQLIAEEDRSVLRLLRESMDRLTSGLNENSRALDDHRRSLDDNTNTPVRRR